MTTALGGRIGLSARRGNRVARPVSLKMSTMPETALIFDPNKTLLDPYALEVSHDPKTTQQPTDEIYCSGTQERAVQPHR
jgi:hypothetical protein